MRRFPANDIISLVGAAPRRDLGESTGPDLRLSSLLDEADAASLAELPLGYGTPEGDRELRRLIAEMHGVAAEEVVITVGGMHALFLLALILCDGGAEAVTTAPLFPLARSALEVAGAQVRVLPLSFDRGYRPPLEQLRARLSTHTKLVSVASPQNPSGVRLSPAELGEILRLMRERSPEACLLVDETYREAVYGEDAVPPSAVGLDPSVISISSLSKCHGAPGLRIGWAVVRGRELREQLVMGKFNTVISCSSLDEALAVRLLERRQQVIGERRVQLAAGLAAVERWVAQHAQLIEWVRPDAGAICCVRLRSGAFDAAGVRRFYAALAAEDARVADGRWFGDDSRIFRLGFGRLTAAELEGALLSVGRSLQHAARGSAT
ncbi:MAG TPA: pyridoxal phosphate-dependent aminotransferase [Steroidobacteraceae bacterium]|nr:pyridoxal phosphate-dependent aminotransferase [Steroidobacteraceae bacterium]